jgi:hypothetical protein
MGKRGEYKLMFSNRGYSGWFSQSNIATSFNLWKLFAENVVVSENCLIERWESNTISDNTFFR